jgi:alkylation response protein AidB-like acyl-CoA dehydrogenase
VRVIELFPPGLTFANIYLGIAQRAIDLAVAGLNRRTSIGIGGRSLVYHPMLQYPVAEMTVTLDAMTAHTKRIADDWSTGVDHGGLWPSKLVATRNHCVWREEGG